MLKVSDLLEKSPFEVLAGKDFLTNEIKNVYIGDLLSWVMGRAKEQSAWITIQGHVNIIAVAILIEASCIIIAEKGEITKDTILKANEENIPILKTSLTAYEVAKIFIKEDV